MIYLDNGATSFHKPPQVFRAMEQAMKTCASPGRGGYGLAMEATRRVYECREEAAALFDCLPEQVALTTSCTHGLNIAIRTLVKPGTRVVISGFEHNAVTRPLHALGAQVTVAGRRLFDWEDTVSQFRRALDQGAEAAVFTHVSNVFGYILPIEELAQLCRERGVPFILDGAQGAGSLSISVKNLGADFLAVPGHKGLLGPQGTGLLICRRQPQPLLYGGTGSASREQDMPQDLPDRLEAGTLNVPGYAALAEGIRYVRRIGPERILAREHRQLEKCVEGLKKKGLRVFAGPHQAATVSFLGEEDCEETAQRLAQMGIAVRAGLHCAPLAHESAGTIETGTVRVSFGHDAHDGQTEGLLRALKGREA